MEYSLLPAPPFEFQGRTIIKAHSGNAVVLNEDVIMEKHFLFRNTCVEVLAKGVSVTIVHVQPLGSKRKCSQLR